MKIKPLLISLVLFGVIFCQPAVSDENEGMPVKRWTFQGEVFNGNDMDPVLTVFEQYDGGEAYGTYQMGEEDGLAYGTLSGFEWESEYLLKCIWEDKYGSGSLRILFSAQYKSFRGFWGMSDDETYYPWDGMELQ